MPLKQLCNKTRRIEGKCERTPRDDDVDGGGDLLRLYHRAAHRRRRRRHRLVLRGGHHLSRARTLPLCHRRCHRLRVGVSRREDIEKTTRTLPVFVRPSVIYYIHLVQLNSRPSCDTITVCLHLTLENSHASEAKSGLFGLLAFASTSTWDPR